MGAGKRTGSTLAVCIRGGTVILPRVVALISLVVIVPPAVIDPPAVIVAANVPLRSVGSARRSGRCAERSCSSFSSLGLVAIGSCNGSDPLLSQPTRTVRGGSRSLLILRTSRRHVPAIGARQSSQPWSHIAVSRVAKAD